MEDTIIYLLNRAYLVKVSNTVRNMFFDFSIVFNTIESLAEKLARSLLILAWQQPDSRECLAVARLCWYCVRYGPKVFKNSGLFTMNPIFCVYF